MTFKKELEIELEKLKKAYWIMIETNRFTYEEIKEVEHKIKKDSEIISYIGECDD